LAIFNLSAAAWDDSQMHIPSDNVTWQLPSGIQGVGDESTCSYATKSLSLHDTLEYRHFIRGFHKFHGKIHPHQGIAKLLHIEYSAGLTWQAVLEAQLKLNGTVQVSLGRCNRYSLSHAGDDPGLPLTDHFLRDLEALPTAVDGDHDEQYLEFVHRYGLYVPTQATFGGFMADLSVLAEADFLAMLRAGLHVHVGAKFHILILFGSADVGIGVDAQAAIDFGAGLQAERMACFPRCAPSGQDVMNNTEPWKKDLNLPQGGVVAPTELTLQRLSEVVLAMEARLPQQLQGEALKKRMDALDAFVEGPLASLTPGVKNATSRPFVAAQADMPPAIAGVHRAASATLGGILYVLGGFVNEAASRTVQVYDPTVGNWTMGPDMPTARTEATAVALNDRLLVCGGLADTGDVLAHCDEYDPSTGGWEAGVSRMNAARVAHAGAVLDGRFYVFGGYATLGHGKQHDGQLMDPLDTIEVLDAGSWRTLDVTLPEALGHMAAATLNGHIHIAGGGSHAHFQQELTPPFSSAMATFDGSSLTASDLALPMPRSGAHLVPTPDGGLVLAGGYGQVHEGEVCEGDGSPVSQTQIFSPETRSWGRGPELPWPVRHGVASVTEDGLQINFVGGMWNVSHGEKGVLTMQIGAMPDDAPELALADTPSAVQLFI
jgi:hypothetical protein